MNACNKLLNTILAILTIMAGTAWCMPAVAADPVLRVIRVSDPSNLVNLDSSHWQKATAVKVQMLPQNITTPHVGKAAIQSIKVKAIHNGRWLAVLLEWVDPTKNNRIVVDQFGDQIAVELPIHYKQDALPSPMMGNPGGRVDIWQWRAAFQHDIDHGEVSVRDLYPNSVVDLYPDQVLSVTDARPYTGALGMDNLISHGRRTPVLDQMAEGWGSMTVDAEGQDADGKGVWNKGAWRVVISHPLASSVGESDINLRPGDDSAMAFAVWDGGSKEVGSRKAWSLWVPLQLAK